METTSVGIVLFVMTGCTALATVLAIKKRNTD